MSPSSTLGRFTGGLAALLLMLAPRPAAASLTLALDLQALTARADRVVLAEVVSVESDWDRERRSIYSTIELVVSESWKGALPATRRLQIVQPGGEVGDVVTLVHGLPSFAVGERAVLFLEGRGRASALVGLGQGKRPLRYDRASRRWMVEPGDRSAAIHLERAGDLRPAAAEPAIALDELRSRVRALLKR